MTFKPYALPIASTIVELSTIELDRVTGGATILPSPTPPPGGGVTQPPDPPPGGGATVPPPLGGRLASLGSDFSKLFAYLKNGASLSTIRADNRTILHDAGVGGF